MLYSGPTFAREDMAKGHEFPSLLKIFASKLSSFNTQFLQILHMDAGDTLELRMTEGDLVGKITFNIELSGLGFD